MYNFAWSLTGLVFVIHNCSAPLSSLLLQADPSWRSVRKIPLSYLKVCEKSHVNVCEHVVELTSLRNDFYMTKNNFLELHVNHELQQQMQRLSHKQLAEQWSWARENQAIIMDYSGMN